MKTELLQAIEYLVAVRVIGDPVPQMLGHPGLAEARYWRDWLSGNTLLGAIADVPA